MAAMHGHGTSFAGSISNRLNREHIAGRPIRAVGTCGHRASLVHALLTSSELLQCCGQVPYLEMLRGSRTVVRYHERPLQRP